MQSLFLCQMLDCTDALNLWLIRQMNYSLFFDLWEDDVSSIGYFLGRIGHFLRKLSTLCVLVEFAQGKWTNDIKKPNTCKNVSVLFRNERNIACKGGFMMSGKTLFSQHFSKQIFYTYLWYMSHVTEVLPQKKPPVLWLISYERRRYEATNQIEAAVILLAPAELSSSGGLPASNLQCCVWSRSLLGPSHAFTGRPAFTELLFAECLTVSQNSILFLPFFFASSLLKLICYSHFFSHVGIKNYFYSSVLCISGR